MLQVAKQEHPSGVRSCRLCLISLATSSPPTGTSCSTSPMRAPGSSSMLIMLTTLPGHWQTGTQQMHGAGIIMVGWLYTASCLAYLHCNENPIYVVPEKYLRSLSPNFHIHVSASDFYITKIGQHSYLDLNRQIDRGNINRSLCR